jgi:hypothetical protein
MNQRILPIQFHPGILAWIEVEVGPRCENLDSAEGMQGKEISVAGENKPGFARQRQSEELIVFGISAERDLGDVVEMQGRATQEVQEHPPVVGLDVSGKFGSGEDFFKLIQSL